MQIDFGGESRNLADEFFKLGQQAGNSSQTEPPALIFDTETDGLAGAHAIQLAFVVEAAGAEVEQFNEYISLTPGRSINKFAQKIHGISEEVLEEKGKPARIVLTEFFKSVDRVLATHGTIVAHNAAFDVAVVNRTAESCDLDRRLASEDVFCTMKESKAKLGLKNVQGRPKAPKNSELFEALVGPVPPDAQLHDALADVRITCKSYRAAKNAGWW